MNTNIIPLSSYDICLARDYAELTYKNHKFQSEASKNKDNKKHYVFVGKLGEVAYKKIRSKEVTEINLELNKTDPGYDFIEINSKLKIDIKTLDECWKRRVYVNANYLNADIYTLMQLDLNNNCANIVGSIDKNNIKKNLVYDSFYNVYYVMKTLFIC